jgi:plastocyanin
MIEDLWSGLLGFSKQFIVPDWGALISLIPILLAGVVILYLVWTMYRFAFAAPTRRGMRRRPPVTPAGIHMPGPSFAPVLAAIGAFFLMFGMVSGGIWLAVGMVVLAITLLYWGREALRDYDHLPDVAHETAGALPAPRGTPPAGVHIPPPSFRPLLVAIAATALVAGMVIGGWALLLGAVAVAITLLGWLWDSRREYAAVEKADRTGHLDLGGAPSWPKATFAALGIIVVLAIVLTARVVPDTGTAPSSAPGGGPGASAAGGGAAGTPGSPAAPALPAGDVSLAAQNIAFSPTDLTAPAGRPFTIAFDNKDNVPHNVAIKDAGGAEVFKGEIVTGPAVKVYDVPSLPAGQYTFVCSVHPNMTGTVTAK